MKIGIVKWIDAVAAGDEWVEETEGTCQVISVGILTKETDSFVTLSLSETEDGLIRGYISIPKSCIVFSLFNEVEK